MSGMGAPEYTDAGERDYRKGECQKIVINLRQKLMTLVSDNVVVRMS